MKWARRKIAVVCATAFAVAYLVCAAATHYYVYRVLLPKIDSDAKLLAEFEPKILSDLKILSEKPVYPLLPRERNAERFISGFIAWDGGATLRTIDHDRLVDFIDRHPEPLKDENKWADVLDDESLEDLDLAWVDQLSAYDHINFVSNPNFHDALSRMEHVGGVERIGIRAELPLLNYKELRFAALARFAQLHLEDRDAEARSIFHHVGYLVMSSDSLIGAMTSVLMMQAESKLAKYNEVEWTVVDETRLNAMKRVAWAWTGILRVIGKGDDLGGFAPYFNRSSFVCASESEPLFESALSDYLEPNAFLEPNLGSRLAIQRQSSDRLFTICEHPEYRVFESPVVAVAFTGRKPNPARIPFLRRMIGLTLVSTAQPNFLKFYEENPREPASK